MVLAAAAVNAQVDSTQYDDYDSERGKYSHGTSPKVCGSVTASKSGLISFNCSTGRYGQHCKVKCSRGVKARNTPQKIYCKYNRWTDKKGKSAYDLSQFGCEVSSYNQNEQNNYDHNNYDHDHDQNNYDHDHGNQSSECYSKKCKKANKKANKDKKKDKKNKKKNKYQSHNEAIEQNKYNGNDKGNNKYNGGSNPYGCVGKHCNAQDNDDNKYKVIE